MATWSARAQLTERPTSKIAYRTRITNVQDWHAEQRPAISRVTDTVGAEWFSVSMTSLRDCPDFAARHAAHSGPCSDNSFATTSFLSAFNGL